MDEVLEREMKWDVDEHFALPRLDDIVAGADVERSTVELTARTTTPPTATCRRTVCCCGGATATTTPAGS